MDPQSPHVRFLAGLGPTEMRCMVFKVVMTLHCFSFGLIPPTPGATVGKLQGHWVPQVDRDAGATRGPHGPKSPITHCPVS
eukprot:CAMPEP_0174351510 /NCGR_PEP_ID=MMETSP0811_2-20130205/8903_1 /TAXON_ID=73025 ORGANISM="Eutreptiella gymnastica-like, Strain CCMP1594" /NCGR_SAMPLE_ID=MMETSP0811_2 /ASSEMBLY_ACC=CAM_ASM_000667 /LENGTH=80 /DNA_ID=CAMNT_0015480815 /DNA_START=707 /DNA_END=949 /DNA_ORIENTATION=+